MLVHAARVYDLVLPIITFGQEARMNRRAVDVLAPVEGERILDVGCGTGLLTVEVARRISSGEVVGIDASLPMIDVARRKRASEVCRFEPAVAENLPFEDASFDAVTSGFFFHHVGGETKRACAREIYRVLRPGGRVVISDIDRPWSLFGWLYAGGGWLLFRQPEIKENMDGLLPPILREAGLADLRQAGGALGCIRVWHGTKPL